MAEQFDHISKKLDTYATCAECDIKSNIGVFYTASWLQGDHDTSWDTIALCAVITLSLVSLDNATLNQPLISVSITWYRTCWR